MRRREHPMSDTPAAVQTETVPEPVVEEELLVEEVSIDGMCGVY
jgi:mycofactocin precursor